MAYVDYAPYVIFFHNQDEYNFAVAAVGGTPATGGIYYGSPQGAAAAFGIPYPFPSGDMDLIDKGVYYTPGYVPPVQLNPTAPPNSILTDALPYVIVPGTTGTNLSTGVDRTIKWAGSIVYMKGDAPLDPSLITNMPQRRWIGGLEVEPTGEGSFSINGGIGCRDASRTLDGLGLPYRAGNIGVWTRRVNEYGALAPQRSWERFYFRVRRLPTANFLFWRCNGTPSPSSGSGLRITPTGTIALIDIDAIGTQVLVSTLATPVTLDTWYRADCLLKYDNTGGINVGSINVFLNGTQIFNSLGLNMNSNASHTESSLGRALADDATLEMDFDDWINADWPLNAGVLTLDSIDWLMGSHVRRIWSTGAGVNVGYTPLANRMTDQGVNPEQNDASQFSSSTASSLITATPDLPPLGVQDKFGEVAVGAAAMIVSVKTTNAASTDGQLGYSIAGGAAVMATIDETAASKFNSVAYRPSGLAEPIEITPVVLRYTKSADANLTTVKALSAVVEYIGIWGAEDSRNYPTDLRRINWLHNCRYPNTAYGMMGPTIDSMVYAVGGTYVGNGTQQEITLPGPCHFLHIRGTVGTFSGIKFITTALNGHQGITDKVIPNGPTRMYYDAVTGLFKFSVTGTSAEINSVGVTYQYIAFCDPGMRFSCAGAYNVNTNVTSRSQTLQNPTFLPEFAMFQKEVLGISSSTNGMFSKGPGNAGSNGNPMDGSVLVANLATFGAGTITTRVDAHMNTAAQVAYIAFRSSEPNCGWVGTQCMTYTGNGTNPRVITLTPASGRFPLFVLVVPNSGGQVPIFRDPSHAGANSGSWVNLANTTLGIVAGGVDSITVQSQLNSNGVIYNVFCIPGALASWANGTFWPPNCDSPEPFYNPVMTPPDLAMLGNGGLTLDGSTTITMLKNISGIYTLVPGKTNDTMYDRQTGQTSVDLKIPDPTAKTGYLGG